MASICLLPVKVIADPPICLTEEEDVPCVFPYKYQGVEYNECYDPSLQEKYFGGTKPWCPTRVDSNLKFLPEHQATCKANCDVVSAIMRTDRLAKKDLFFSKYTL